jgi:hypothetical protein
MAALGWQSRWHQKPRNRRRLDLRLLHRWGPKFGQGEIVAERLYVLRKIGF